MSLLLLSCGQLFIKRYFSESLMPQEVSIKRQTVQNTVHQILSKQYILPFFQCWKLDKGQKIHFKIRFFRAYHLLSPDNYINLFAKHVLKGKMMKGASRCSQGSSFFNNIRLKELRDLGAFNRLSVFILDVNLSVIWVKRVVYEV